MEEKFNTEPKDWSTVEKKIADLVKESVKESETKNDMWPYELVEQSKVSSRRWFAICVIIFAALVATNAYWIHTMNSYEYVYQDGSGQNNYNNNVDGDVNNVATDKTEEER